MISRCFLIISLLGLIKLSVGQFIQSGQCDPNIEIATNFDLAEFVGTWHETARSSSPFQRDGCATLQFTRPNNEGNTLNVVRSAVVDNFLDESSGTAVSTDGSARLTLNVPSYPSNAFNFWILITDHNNFALAYSCENVNATFRSVHLWQLGRQTTYPNDLMLALMNTAIVNRLGLDPADLESVSHTATTCYVLPVIQPGNPIILQGQCDTNIPVVQNFNVQRFLGVWHEISSYHSENALGTCPRAEYTLGASGVNIVNSQVVNQRLNTVTGNAVARGTDGRLTVTINVSGTTPVQQNLLILATDYEDYAVSYVCSDLPNNQKRVFSWILSRNRQLSQAAQDQVNRVVDSIMDLNYVYFQQARQTDADCFYYPIHIPGQPVLFRGQCSNNIPVVQNFDAASYLGLWHDIESYPNEFQDGTCSNAYYSLSPSGVDVLNTQVVSQSLVTINGLAVIASDDNSARLTVTFPIAGTNSTAQTDYWVVATDYNSYSLVYSCRNVNSDQRLVTSWKLSRTKQLTAAATTAISAAIATVDVLDQQYYESMDQTTQGCFYYPEPQPGVPVVFPGQCDESLATVANFNLNQFQGTWYEIEAYPKDQQPGHCVTHQFAVVSATAYNLQSTSVYDQFREVTSSQVTRAANEANGRFTVTLTTNGITVSFPYWILATDYSSYALAYSCVNLNSDFRGIWSWKLSRTQSLTTAAVTAINNVITPIQVLSNDYYEAIDQSEDACFYLPDIPAGQPIVLIGQCNPNIAVVQNFDAARYLGRWRLIESYRSDSQQGTCEEANYSLGSDGSVVVFNTEVRNQNLATITGTAVPTYVDGSGKLTVTFPNQNPFEYWILDTDYDSYALVYGCENINAQQQRIWSWKLSRTNSLTQNAITAINQVLNRVQVLNNRFYQTSDRSDAGCFYFPEPNNNPVVFRGQCNQNIAVVQNFDTSRYTGLWHDIESYPTEFQDGTCNNALYTLTSNGVEVYNTQVVNQALDTITGLATLASDDNSAKLTVSFPIAGTNQTSQANYWVLATDYNSYSLVYSCRNINDEQRQVTIWKLSRTKQLTPAAVTAINIAMSNVDVVDQRYFRVIDQTTAGCFYYPVPQPGVPVVFPGQCDITIPVVQNFNFAQFQDIWHEIQAYPKEQQTGQCVNHQFTQSGTNGFSLISSSVASQFLDTTNSVVASVTNDNTGRFTITMTTGGTTISFPYWILATDYTSYALAYSCLNINSDFRGVWSWKLSRTQALTAAANTAINTVIAPIQVLGNEYYESIDQSDQACFHLPDIPAGQPVILPGQCDSNIAVVQNFNATRYLGRWRLIESYASDSQRGTCAEATYSSGTAGSVVVVNTEVRNRELATMTGSAVASTDGSGKLSVTFPNTPTPFDYWILDTDYDSFALVYGCANVNNQQRRVWSWKLSRTNTLTANAVNSINQVINRINVLDAKYYHPEDRSDNACFYLPTPGPNPVVFRGQCNQNIPVVQNFDAERYLGLWHDIERYPSEFQSGTCSNAYYSLSAAGVDVYNTQVINQALDTINGLAVLATTDNSAKLTVTFPVAGTNTTVQTEYWVLATDYVSYSLVYSCRNLNDEQQQVISWKLSRTKQLTTAASIAINNVISTVDVLEAQYFNSIDQSATGCFYYPVPQLGVPVVFPGQCDTNIPVVQSFNFAQFQGIWHEIQAYPKEQQTGQCVNHQFTQSGTNGFSLISSSVASQFLDTTNSVVASVTNDNTGRFTITMTAGGTTITFPYWILATDYTGYALAYSCLNLNSDFRAVWSWKLSRTQALTAAANTAINTVIAPIQVLGNEYYESIDQSDQACFHLPDIPAGQPVILPGQCDSNIAVVQNFNATRYLGRWRQIESYASDSQRGTCAEATYSLGTGGSVVVVNTEVRNRELATMTGSAVASTDGSGKLSVTFPNTPAPFDYWILDTDYDSFALVYGCANVNNQQRRVWSWKLSRTNALTANAVNSINQVINRINVLDAKYYHPEDRSDNACFYLPTPGPNPVVFRGQCNQNIPVVQNFDAERYLGLWHDIERYPTEFQSGTCSNAYYSLSAAGVDVYNTQVINQALDTINGLAVLATTDGSAKLTVTFPVAGTNSTVQTEYWVLATDYASYSLVYSCRNLNDEQRQVTSWKLSRTKQLTTAATVAINAVINTVDVLDQQYFTQIDQTPTGCFYFPEPQPGVPVVFPGQCDLNFPVVQSFSMNQFQGLWHEIEAYPKIDQPGQCINHQFTSTGAISLSLVSTNVVNQALGVSTGTVTFSSTDSSARLVITLTTNGTTAITIPYWIVATDYTNYALAYSCVNYNNDYRGVWSWKLSRSKSLSQASNQAISNIMSQVDVIDSRYFEDINQSDESCFYLPDLAPGEPVVIVGQCDPNISVMQNFNVTRYLGRWNLIETYPADFQTGECNDATYTMNPNGTLIVYNTNVVNQALNSITGSAVVASTDGSARLLVTFPSSTTPAELWILDTDYETYTLVYSCANQGTDRRRVWSWKMSRTNELSTNAITAINQVMSRVNVLENRYFLTVQRSATACFYFPTPGTDPVRFRGQCEQNIPVVQNFNVQRYMGKWHDIESYPSLFQRGTCNNAEYTLYTDSTVSVYNEQVVNQVLDVMSGTAVLASTDGSARLRVTFPVSGENVTTDYWVLATDYDNYALVYSCTNIDDEYRGVYSWKLSRQQNLTPAANTAINTVINSVQVLRQDYFIQRDHSEQGCFYYPDNFGGDVILSGQCLADNLVQAVTNFNASGFSGTWHEVARFPSDLQNGECAATQYVLNSQNSFSVTQTIIRDERQYATFIPSASVSSDGRGIISATVSGVPINTIYILATDNTEYALAYACRNLNASYKQIYSWKLSRTRAGLSPAANIIIDSIVSDNIDLFEGYYSYTRQTNDACFHYPVFDPLPSYIRLPGPCDTTIRGVTNFNTAAYMGAWTEIARYPQPTQRGQCNRAQYTSENNAINVRNSEVIDQILSIREGTAVVASNDGSAVWDVTFNLTSGPATTNLYVLATDYTSYALVYSCRNLDDGYRSVGSWKFSRTSNLNIQANNIIDAMIGNTQGLLEDYYISTSQSDEDCFYIPEAVPNQPILFRGRCENITGIQNFDINRYLGWWHEIESYPSSAIGECSSSQYESSGNQYRVVDTRVVNNEGIVETGTVVATSNGRLTRTLSNGEVQILWVLATDYDNYSLLYSCEDVDAADLPQNEQYRRVWSAKHSKARQLTAAAQNAMASVINANQVLDTDLYLPVNQSDSSCFHYPAQTGTRVILPGQCSEAIPVVQNFDVEAYTGTWYQIERYDQIHENGTCIGARYTLEGNTGVVNVLNWEIIGDVLDTIEGTAVISSTDGSAKLDVTLPIVGTNDTVTTSLYVLTTDYESYSLAYSCDNINRFQRAVGAWKLSRTRTMPAGGTTAINAYMAQREELYQPYFLRVAQSDDCEEPSSAFLVKSSIISMLICVVLQMLL